MRPSESLQRSPVTPNKNRSRIFAALAAVGLAVGFYECGRSSQEDTITQLRADLKLKEDGLTFCTADNEAKQADLGKMKRKLARVQASKKKLNDWQNFLNGMRPKHVAKEKTEDEQTKVCRDLKSEKAEIDALDMIDSLGITNEADRQALIDSYKQGCYVNNVENGKVNMQQKDSPYCSVELEEEIERNHVDPDLYADASVAEEVVLEAYRDKDYQGALDSYSAVITEMENGAESIPGLQDLPIYDEFKNTFKDVYGDMKNGNTLDGVCRFFALMDKVKKYESKLEALFSGDSEEKIMQVLSKMLILSNIAEKLVKRDYPHLVYDFDNSKLIAECNKRGFSMSTPSQSTNQ